MTELRKNVLNEIDALSKKDDIAKNLENNLYNLYGYIENENNLKDDRDIRIFLYANRDHAAVKPFSHDPDYKEINQIITGKEPNLIKEDIKLKDIFGDTYLEPGVLAGIKGEHFKKLTDANKADFYEVLKAAEDEAVSKDREDIFFGTNFLQQMFTPRTYERRMRGEDDNYKDLGLDVFENAAYTFLPGNALKYIAKIPQAIPTVLAKGASVVNTAIDKGAKGAKGAKVANIANTANAAIDKGAKGLNKGIDKLIDNTATNFAAGAVTNPFMMESLDDLAYDDNENTDRKDFSLTDALIGAGVNIGAPMAFKAPVGMVGRMLGGAKRGPKMSRWVNQLGEGKSISDISNEAIELGQPKYTVLKAQSAVKNHQQKIIKPAAENVKKAEEMLAAAKKSNNKKEIELAEANLKWHKEELNKIEKSVDDLATVITDERDKIGYKEYDENLFDYLPELSMLDKTAKEIKKSKNYFTNLSRGTYEQKAEIVDKVLNKLESKGYKKQVNRNELLNILEDVKFDSDKAAEGYLLSYVTNKYGDMMYGDKSSTLPIVGPGIKWLNERELSNKRQKVRDSFSKMHFLPDDTKKESK